MSESHNNSPSLLVDALIVVLFFSALSGAVSYLLKKANTISMSDPKVFAVYEMATPKVRVIMENYVSQGNLYLSRSQLKDLEFLASVDKVFYSDKTPASIRQLGIEFALRNGGYISRNHALLLSRKMDLIREREDQLTKNYALSKLFG